MDPAVLTWALAQPAGSRAAALAAPRVLCHNANVVLPHHVLSAVLAYSGTHRTRRVPKPVPRAPQAVQSDVALCRS